MLSHRSGVRNLAIVLLYSAAGVVRSDAVPDFAAMNDALGIALWSDGSLWDDAAADAASRLGWPLESATSSDSSYRKYPGAAEVVLGTRPYSLALYGEGEKVARVSMMFANKGDSVAGELLAGDAKETRELKKSIKSACAAIQQDAATVVERLTALLGPPVADRFGQSRQTRESVKRWDWNGHAILLAAPEEEYVAVRILPSAVADLGGKSRIPDAELRSRLLSRVERRPNGDVILKDMPMVDQGPKGYCVPATWERVMRYMGIPADMYVLAMASDTTAVRGTSIDAITAGAREAVVRGGRRLDPENGKAAVRTVRKYIDRGLPLMWVMYSMDAVNQDLNARMAARNAMEDPVAWTKSLDPARKAAKKIPVDSNQAHMCMIIGYNETTGEIAVSDSWGPDLAERWITEEEADAISLGSLMAINF